MKKCKQCGKVFVDDMFRPYYPRGTGQRKTKVGRNTVCLPCEKFNTTVNRVWKKVREGVDISEKEELLLSRTAEFYKKLVDQGNQPIGAYARHVLGAEVTRKTSVDEALELIDTELNKIEEAKEVEEVKDEIEAEYDKLLTIELTDEPDVYQDMLVALLERSSGPNGKVLPKYREKFEAVARRFDEYEDNYVWE